MKRIICIATVALFFSCSTTKNGITRSGNTPQNFTLTGISTDPSYGYSPKHPIEVGGVDKDSGPINERKFLNALAGPNGEKVSYVRAGSCCPIKSKKNPMGGGKVMLDNYLVTWEGAQDTVSLFINMYDYGVLTAPKGFTIKK